MKLSCPTKQKNTERSRTKQATKPYIQLVRKKDNVKNKSKAAAHVARFQFDWLPSPSRPRLSAIEAVRHHTLQLWAGHPGVNFKAYQVLRARYQVSSWNWHNLSRRDIWLLRVQYSVHAVTIRFVRIFELFLSQSTIPGSNTAFWIMAQNQCRF